jgi:hypothetical protein
VFATVHTDRDALPDGRAPAGAIEVAHLDGSGSTTVAFWPDEDSAPAGARVYRAVDRLDGPDAGRTPLFAQVTWVNGTGDPAVARAAERGGRERINPAIRDVPGLIGVLVLESADHRIVVVGTATALEAQTEVTERIERTPLLPDEDPALLPGYDRTELGRVLRADVPVEVRS